MTVHVNTIEAFLEALVAELEIPEHRYDQAERSFKSLGEWLHREESSVRRFDAQVYCQGSFRLGTAIRPLTEDEVSRSRPKAEPLRASTRGASGRAAGLGRARCTGS